MNRIYRLFLAVVFVMTAAAANAQNEGLSLSLLPDIPYNNYLNPGNRVKYNGIIGFGISNVNLGVFNSSVKYKNIYRFEDGVPVAIDADKFINSLKEQDNFVNTEFSLDMINAGFRVKKLFFNIDWRLKMSAGLDYSKDFLGFFIWGNGNYMGDNPADFNIDIDAILYSELGVGVQYEVTDKLTIGIRPKLLNGIAHAQIINDRTKIFTNPDTYNISADVNLDVKASSILDANIYTISDLKNLFNADTIRSCLGGNNITENMGFGIDFGASWAINNHWGVSASVCDLGFVKWKNTKVKQTNVVGTQVVDDIIDDIRNLKIKLDYNSLLDEVVKKVWGNDSLYKGDDYTTSLKTRIIVDGYYELNPMLRITALGQVIKYKDAMYPAFTVAYSGSFVRHIDLTVNYTASKYCGNSVGVGIGFHFGPVNFYAVTDNVLMLSKIGKSTVEMCSTYSSASIRAGLVFTIGKLPKEEAKAKVEN